MVEQHARLVLIARNKERLKEAKEKLDEKGNGEILLLSADVANKDQIFAAIQQAGEHFGRIDIVINCAGIITCGHFSDQSIDELEACLSVNYAGALYTAKAGWSWLKKSKGQLSFVSSVAGYIGLIGYSSYAPTKFAIAGLAECLRMEGKNDGIAVSIVYPPDTDTPLLEYERAYALPETIALSGTIKAMSAKKVASIYLRGIAAHKFAIHCNANSRFLQWLKSNFPSLFYAIMDKICRRAAAAERMESKIKATIGNAG